VTLPNWPGMYCCFQSLRKINDWYQAARLHAFRPLNAMLNVSLHACSIKQEATRSNGGLCAEEASFLETKMQIIKCFLFNSPEAHQSMYVPLLLSMHPSLLFEYEPDPPGLSPHSQPKQVEELDFDITPFLHKQEYELMFEFLSASDCTLAHPGLSFLHVVEASSSSFLTLGHLQTSWTRSRGSSPTTRPTRFTRSTVMATASSGPLSGTRTPTSRVPGRTR